MGSAESASDKTLLEDSCAVETLDINVVKEGVSIQDALSSLDLQVADQLGSGTFGTIHAAWCEQTQSDVAVKVVEFTDEDLDDDRMCFAKEVTAMKALGDSRYVVSIQRGAFDKDLQAGVIVMERADGSDLENYLKEGEPLESDDAIWIGLRVAKALGDMHAAGLVHRDVKSSNVLLYACDAGKTIQTAKLGDLGLVAERGEAVSSVAGTLEFMPSNLVASWQNEDQPPPKPCFSDDMFAFGCVMLELMGAISEFDHWNKRRRRRIRENRSLVEFEMPHRLREAYCPALIEAIESCLDEDARMRPTAVDMVRLLSSMTGDRQRPRLLRAPTASSPKASNDGTRSSIEAGASPTQAADSMEAGGRPASTTMEAGAVRRRSTDTMSSTMEAGAAACPGSDDETRGDKNRSISAIADRVAKRRRCDPGSRT